MIYLEKDGPLAIVMLTNPPLNVLHPQMAAELDACFTSLATDPEVVVAIVTGQGERAFCAGFDIKEFPNLMAPGEAERLTRALHASLGKIAHLGKPTIAAVNVHLFSLLKSMYSRIFWIWIRLRLLRTIVIF